LVERLHNKAPTAAAALLELKGFMHIDGVYVRKFGRLGFGDPDRLRRAFLHCSEAEIAGDYIKPRGETAIAAVFVEVPVSSQKDLLSEISCLLAVMCEAETPTSNPGLMAAKQFVGRVFQSGRSPVVAIGVDEFFVRKRAPMLRIEKRHRRNYC